MYSSKLSVICILRISSLDFSRISSIFARLNKLGLELLVDKDHRLPSLNAVKIPEGIDDLPIRSKLLNDYHIEIGGGLGLFAGKIWRIGLMGHSAREENINTLLNAFKEIL